MCDKKLKNYKCVKIMFKIYLTIKKNNFDRIFMNNLLLVSLFSY